MAAPNNPYASEDASQPSEFEIRRAALVGEIGEVSPPMSFLRVVLLCLVSTIQGVLVDRITGRGSLRIRLCSLFDEFVKEWLTEDMTRTVTRTSSLTDQWTEPQSGGDH